MISSLLSFSRSLSFSPSISRRHQFPLVSLQRTAGTFAVRCCDDATGTYMVIMWHGCRSRVVVSHREALSYRRKGAPIRGPPVKPVRRGSRVWHAAHPRTQRGARLRGIPAGFYPALSPSRLSLISSALRRRGVFSPGRSRHTWHQRLRVDCVSHNLLKMSKCIRIFIISLINHLVNLLTFVIFIHVIHNRKLPGKQRVIFKQNFRRSGKGILVTYSFSCIH